MTDGQTVNRIQILRNELFGEIEIVQTSTQTFIAKRLTPRSAALFEKAHRTYPFLFSNEFPFLQEFHAQTEIFGHTYLLFKYYDFSLQNMLDGNRRAALQMPENMLVKLMNDLFFAITFLKNKGLIYPVVHNKTIFVSKTGNLRLTNPLLFEEGYVNLGQTADEGQALLEADKRFGDVGRICIEQASFANLFGPDATPADYEAALTTVRQKYSYDFFNFVRKFDFYAPARVPSESRFQNYNAAENYFNVNCSNVDKYLAGMKLAALDFEIPKSTPGKVYTIKNGSIFKVPDRKNVIFDSERQTSHIFGNDLNGSAMGRSLRTEQTIQRPYPSSTDIPPAAGQQVFGPYDGRVNVISMGAQDQSGMRLSNRSGGSGARVYAQATPGEPLVVANTQSPNFSKKKTEDSFFDEVFERAVIAEPQPVRVSNTSEPRASLPSQYSLKTDNFFDIPTEIQEPYQAAQPNPFKMDHNVSASFRNNPFNTSVRESAGSDFRRSRSSNPVEPQLVNNAGQQNDMLKYAMTSPVYIDPNESFSKRLAQFYQKEYRERNDSMRDSLTSNHVAQPARFGSPQTQVVYGQQPMQGDKSYAIIHDFPVNS